MVTGFFGKMPGTGDFVARGLAPGHRPILDRWLTSHIVDIASRARAWPEGGVRALLEDSGPLLLVIEPSEDSAGRLYPLVACAIQNGAGRNEANVWAERAWTALLSAIEDGAGPDDLAALLARVASPRAGRIPLEPPLMWWSGVSPAHPSERLAELARITA